MRLIDTDKVNPSDIIIFGDADMKQRDFNDAVKTLIFYQLTVDAVPVVRCKDCIWYAEKETGEGWCSEVMARPMPHNGFCSYGEKED